MFKRNYMKELFKNNPQNYATLKKIAENRTRALWYCTATVVSIKPYFQRLTKSCLLIADCAKFFNSRVFLFLFNFLALELLFFLILAHSVYKM